MTLKKTKIIATVGPAIDSEELLGALMDAGMDIARLNFSHGTHKEHAKRVDLVKRVRSAKGRACPLILDTKGPEIRTAALSEPSVSLYAGATFTLYEPDRGPELGSAEGVRQSHAGLWRQVRAEDTILIDDGLIELKVLSASPEGLDCKVLNDAELGSKKSINIPGVKIDLPALTQSDCDDIRFGLEQGFDFVAASFVRDAHSVLSIKDFIASQNKGSLGIIAKIENASAVEHIEEIIQVADAIMIARGDLGVEVPAERVPHIQKEIIALCNKAHKPVITATQMLDSMMRNPRPTRAEVADVANAIYDGTDCVMLSGETAMGAYPLEAVRTMAKVAKESEAYLVANAGEARALQEEPSVSLAVGVSAVRCAQSLQARCLVTPTMSGRSARLISNLRPKLPIYAISPSEHVVRMMELYWGVTPLTGDVVGDVEPVINKARDIVVAQGYVRPGDICVFTVGHRDTAPQVHTEIAADAPIAPTNILYIIQIH